MSTQLQEVVRGTNIYLMKKGEGSPVLFLHGLHDDKRAVILDKLAENHTVFYPNHPWFGDSESVESIENVQDLAFFYLDLLDQYGIEKVHVIGSSFGGWIAMEMAVMEPKRVEKLVLANASGIYANGAPVVDFFMLSQEDSIRAMFFDKSLADKVLQDIAQSEELTNAYIKNRMALSHFGFNPYFHNPQLVNRLHRLTMPVQIVWGESDELFSLAYGKQLAQVLPQAAFKVMEQCGHMPHIEQPDAFYDVVSAFLANKEVN